MEAGGRHPAVRKIEAADVQRVAGVLARAFHADPPSAWFFPNLATRSAKLERSFALMLRRLYLRHGECYVTVDLHGAAAWLPPTRRGMGRLEVLHMVPGLVRLFGRRLPRVMGGFNLMEGAHPSEPHYYLPVMGVDPRHQGEGIGKALMAPILRRCDEEHTPAYLEATTPRNRAFYERLGFELVRERRFPHGGPPLWGMGRWPVEKS